MADYNTRIAKSRYIKGNPRKNLIVKPIIKNNLIININFTEKFLNGDEIYALKQNFKIYNKINICHKLCIHVLDLSNDNCVTKIILNKKSTCAKSNVHHLSCVEEIADGLVLLQDVSKTVLTKTISIN